MLRKMSPCVTLTRLVMFALFAILTGQCFAQNPSKWLKEEKTDPLRGTSYLQFSLDGQFLTPPRNTAPNTKPTMILRCTPSSFSRDHLHGKLMSGYIFVGAVVETRESSLGGTRVDAKFRLDDGKLQTSPLSHSRDFSSIYLSETDYTGTSCSTKRTRQLQSRKPSSGLMNTWEGKSLCNSTFQAN